MSKTIFRAARKNHPYFSFRRATAQDRRLSYEARGLLAYLLSKPDDWILKETDLQKQAAKCGRDKARRIIKELEVFKYLFRGQVHNHNGQFDHTVYWVFEIPHDEQEIDPQKLLEQYQDEFKSVPLTEKPTTGKPTTENPQHTYIESLHTEDSTEKTELPNGSSLGESPGGDPLVHGFGVGEVVYWTEDDWYTHESGTVERGTDHFVFVRLPDGSDVRKKPHLLHRETGAPSGDPVSALPKMQQAIARGLFGMDSGHIVTKTRAIHINQIVHELNATFYGKPVNVNELWDAIQWHVGGRDQGGRRLTPNREPSKVADLVNDYRASDAYKARVNSSGNGRYRKDADPGCAICQGLGTIIDGDGKRPCDCRRIKTGEKHE